MSYLCNRVCENKTSYGYCKTTYCIYPEFPHSAVSYTFAKLKTNVDSIRNMTDEELAEWIIHIAYCSDCPIDRQCPINAEQCQGNRSKCYLAWLEWLKSEA